MTCPRIGLSRSTVGRILNPPRLRSFDFVCRYVRNHKGEPFNPLDYPWTEHICDTWDRMDVESITMQFCARVGKTVLAMSLMVSAIANDPTTFMYGNANETLVKDTVREKWYPMFARCVPTRNWVPPKSRQIQTRINLTTCQGYCAWSGSPTQLADKDPKYLHAGEVDKWNKQASDEADSLDLFLERGIEIPDRKVLIESTPQITGRSRVEQHLLTGWNSRFHVPCPRCGRFQQLVFGDGDRTKGGIIFDKLNGKLDANTAYATARYQCAFCLKEIHEDHRRSIIQKGVWVPEGQYALKTGRIVGEMKNPGAHASYQLSRIYAPTFSFASCARAFVGFHQKGALQNWLNSWMGWTWQPVMSADAWEVVAARMAMDYEIGTVPDRGCFLVAAVDVQIDHWVYMVAAFGPHQDGYVVDYGVCHSWKEVSDVLEREYPHADGGEKCRIGITLIDAKDGNRQDEVIDYCRGVNKPSGPFVWPCYGAKAGAMGMQPYKRNFLEADNKMGKQVTRQNAAGFCVVTVNTNYWQQWMHNALYHRNPGEPRSLGVPLRSKTDADLFEQWTNELPDTKKDMTNHESYIWVVVSESIPVDFRDTARYCRCAAEVYTRSNWERVYRNQERTQAAPSSPNKAPAPAPARSRMPKRKNWVRQHRNRHYGR